MVLSILIAVVAAPGLLGTQEAIRQSQSKEKREEHRARRCNLIASCVKSSMRSREINGRPIVLKDGKLWIDTGTSDGSAYGHPYAGYYLPYPDTKYEGLVTTITDVAPIMNWVYVDKDTYEVKYGVRLDAQPNLTGPFDCTRQDRRLTFDGWEGWCAVEEFPTLWALYYDVDDDGLRSKVAPGTRVLEIELTRKEKRFKKEVEARQQDQTTKREVEASEDAPVDKPLTVDPKTQTPGVVGPIPGISTEAPKPFNLPKSIFNDPPLPPPDITAQIPIPKTPPPEYTPETRSTTNTTPSRDLSSTPDTRSASRTAATSPSSQPVTVPTEPLPLAINKERTTPKLDRSRSSCALAQAQMFEAMAAGQKQNNSITPRNGKSRLSGNTDSGSEYSNDGTPRLSRDVLGVFEGRPDSSALPQSNEVRSFGDPSSQRSRSPQRLTVRAANTTTDTSRANAPQERTRTGGDPAVFGGRLSPDRPGLSRSRTNAVRGGFGLAESPNIRERPSPPKRSQTLPNRGGNESAEERRPIGTRNPRPADNTRTVTPEQRRPGVSRAPTAPSIRGNAFAEQQRRPSASRETSTNNTRAVASEQQRRPSASKDTYGTSNNVARSSPRPNQRNGSTSSTSSFLNEDPAASRSSPRNLNRTGSAATRKSLAATMSSSRGNKAMATRVGGDTLPPPPRNPANARTTSALLREIDDLVNMEADEGPPLPPPANNSRNRAPPQARGGVRDERQNRDTERRPGRRG